MRDVEIVDRVKFCSCDVDHTHRMAIGIWLAGQVQGTGRSKVEPVALDDLHTNRIREALTRFDHRTTITVGLEGR